MKFCAQVDKIVILTYFRMATPMDETWEIWISKDPRLLERTSILLHGPEPQLDDLYVTTLKPRFDKGEETLVTE
jgi:hypothetical protein